MNDFENRYCYEYPRPMVTVDIVCFRQTCEGVRVLLIRRGKKPFKDCWAIPGGFVEMEEGLETAARRELKEETHLEPVKMEQFYCFGEPGRDPRGRTISIAFLAWIDDKDEASVAKIRADDDACDVQWFDPEKLPPLAFDHDKIIRRARKTFDEWRKMGKIEVGREES